MEVKLCTVHSTQTSVVLQMTDPIICISYKYKNILYHSVFIEIRYLAQMTFVIIGSTRKSF